MNYKILDREEVVDRISMWQLNNCDGTELYHIIRYGNQGYEDMTDEELMDNVGRYLDICELVDEGLIEKLTN
jgi:uncharacterized protein YvpB